MAPDSKVVLVTGCSSGIGHATAARLAERGCTVYATARKVETIADLEAAGGKTMALDVTDEASMGAAVQADARGGGRRADQQRRLLAVRRDRDRRHRRRAPRQFETNVFGLVRITQLVLPGMRARGQQRS